MTLNELQPGNRGKIISIREDSLTLKLLEMGFIPGEIVGIEHRTWDSDPIAVRISGYLIGLRREEAALIEVESISS